MHPIMKYRFLKILFCLILFTVSPTLTARINTTSGTSESDILRKNFATPPSSARPWVYWFWVNSNISRKGITADLEAMQRVGIGGVLIMDISLKIIQDGTPAGPCRFMDSQWKDLFHFAVQEAKRLGLEITMANDAGWTGSGGPWIKPAEAMQTVVFSETPATGGRETDLVLPAPPSNGGFYRDIAVLAIAGRKDSPKGAIENLAMKALFAKSGIFNQFAPQKDTLPAGTAVAPDNIRDISGMMDRQGHLRWKAPPGNWNIIRFGHTFTGATNKPSAPESEGPECDKLSKEGVRKNFDGMMKNLLKLVGPEAGKTLVAAHIDSWEVGAQNWTGNMPEEFRLRRGYNLIPWLPVLCGNIIGDLQKTERFLWDYRKTISELMVENYVAEMRDLCHKNGLLFSMEPYNTIGNDLDAANYPDLPMSEFWTKNGGDWYSDKVKGVASSAHLNNRTIVGAESFTCAEEEKWQQHPATMKSVGDRFFCDGVNQFVIHRYAMQPWDNLKPGISMGPFGVHYERTQTWWEYTLPWHTYLARCQYLLRQGTFVADVLNLQPEEPIYRYRKMKIDGYDFDACSPDAFLKVKTENGMLVDGAGNRHRLLVMTHTGTMTVAMLRRIRDLVTSGASLLGEPPASTPGLADYPEADAKLKKLVNELWGNQSEKERKVGSGKVFRQISAEEALGRLGIRPDFVSDRKIRYIHRTINDKDNYFIANSADSAVTANCVFRVSGKSPQWWDPETGSTRDIPCYSKNKDGTVSIRISLPPSGSGFVLFTPAKAVSPEKTGGNDNKPFESFPLTFSGITEIKGPWKLQFPEEYSDSSYMVLNELKSWTLLPVKKLNYFSGTATYSRNITIPAGAVAGGSRLYLDLGKVHTMAKLYVNGSEAGILWKPPYCTDISNYIREGENSLKIEVVNLWVNRQIGDEFLPEDSERNPNGTLKSGVWPGWILNETPGPTGRYSFTTWRLWKKEDPLQDSGMLGPVYLKQSTANHE